jgi:hypothetical protein
VCVGVCVCVGVRGCVHVWGLRTLVRTKRMFHDSFNTQVSWEL